jgi:hypothetical protein
MKRIILALLMILVAQVCHAGTINVPGDSATIQTAINGASNGDTVLVADGTYTGDGNRDILFHGKDIVVMSQNGPGFTIIDPQGSESEPHRAFNFINNAISGELEGFTIKNGYGPFSHNHNEGGAMLIENASPTIKYCVFANNIGAYQGGAVSCFTSSPIFINCTFAGNAATYGGCIYSNGANPVLENCIIAFSAEGSAAFCNNDGTVDLLCCDLYGNLGGDYVECVQDQLGLDGNISSDPLFCDTENNDFHIAICSPCGPLINTECGLIGALEAGCASAPGLPFAYQPGFDPVMDDSLVTSSSFEIFWSYFDTTSSTQNGYEIEVGTDNDWSVAEMWSSGQVVSSDTNAIYAGIALYDDTKYYVRIRVSNGTDWGIWSETRFYSFFDNKIYISEDYLTIQTGIDYAFESDTVFVRDGTYSGDGNRDIDFGGKNIVVKSENGPESTIIQGAVGHRGFYIHSGEDTTSVIDGITITGFSYAHNDGGAILCLNAGLTIKNCIITGNMNVNAFGPGIYGYYANIRHFNCVFSDNRCPLNWCDGSSEYHNGTYEFTDCLFTKSDSTRAVFVLNADVTFTNCTFAGNMSGIKGAGMRLSGCNAVLSNCIFSNNMTVMGLPDYAPGGGLSCSSCITTVSNCTFIGNRAYRGSSIYHEGGQLTVENSIFAFSADGVPINCDPADIADISCTNIFGNIDGDWVGDISAYAGINGNLSLDPMFCDTANDDFEIDSISPCAPYSPENTCGILIGAKDVGCGLMICGDANGDEFVNVSDAVSIINYVFLGGAPADPLCLGDANGDGVVSVSDAVYIINYVFVGGNPPYPSCCDE